MWSNLIGLCQLHSLRTFSLEMGVQKAIDFLASQFVFLNLVLKQINFKGQFLLYLW